MTASALNFSNTTPAAPTGSQNILWQNDNGASVANQSAYDPAMVGDAGSGGKAGNVPAPPAGSAAAGKFLKADGTFAIPAGTGVTASALQQQTNLYAADTGTANAYAATLSPAPTLVAGSAVIFKAANANTGASTLAVNGGSAIAIKKSGSTALSGGEIAPGQIVEAIYDGTSFQIGASTGGPSSIAGQAIAPSTIATTGDVQVGGYLTDAGLVAIGPNTLGLVLGAVDSHGQVAWGITSTGAIIGAPQLPAGTVITNLDINLPGYLTDVGFVSLSPYNPLGLIFAHYDLSFQVSWGVTKAGVPTFYGLSASSTTSSGTASLNQTANPFAPNVDSLSFYNAPDGSAIQQISKVAETPSSTFTSTSGNNYATVTGGTAIAQLTSGSSNHSTQPAPNQDESWIRFLKTPTGGGAPTVMKMNRWGQHQIPVTTGYAELYALSHVLFGGQSLSIGTTGTPVLSTTEPFSNLMFNGGTVPGANDTTTPMPAQTSLVPLVEAVLNGALGETIATCFAATVFQWMAEAGINMKLLLSGWGVGGQPYSALAKGTLPYTRGQQQVSQGQSLAASAGFSTFGVRSLLWVHGEADQFNASYDANLATLQSNFESDVMALTGQATNVPLILCQTSGLCSNAVTPDTVLSQYLMLQAAVNNPGKIVLTGPSYMCPYNNIHMTNLGYRKLAGYFAKAWLKTVIQNLPWRPLSPRKIVRDGANIYVDFWVPTPPIKINLSDVLQPSFVSGSMYGFEYFDASGSPPAITAVNITGPTTLQIVLASAPTGSNKQLRYARSFVGSTIPGPQTGQRGNLCDSDTTTNFYGDKLPNWCVHFNQAIN